MINTVRTARMIRTVITDVSASETVQLVSSVEMHPPYLNRIVTRRAQCMGIRRNRRTQYLVVGPDLSLIRISSRN